MCANLMSRSEARRLLDAIRVEAAALLEVDAAGERTREKLERKTEVRAKFERASVKAKAIARLKLHEHHVREEREIAKRKAAAKGLQVAAAAARMKLALERQRKIRKARADKELQKTVMLAQSVVKLQRLVRKRQKETIKNGKGFAFLPDGSVRCWNPAKSTNGLTPEMPASLFESMLKRDLERKRKIKKYY